MVNRQESHLLLTLSLYWISLSKKQKKKTRKGMDAKTNWKHKGKQYFCPDNEKWTQQW